MAHDLRLIQAGGPFAFNDHHAQSYAVAVAEFVGEAACASPCP